jgi:hypothetical protein
MPLCSLLRRKIGAAQNEAVSKAFQLARGVPIYRRSTPFSHRRIDSRRALDHRWTECSLFQKENGA